MPGSCTLPLPGIKAAIVDETGKELANGAGGMLVVKRPWPSMIRTIWNDPERFKTAYFPAEMGGTIYLAGDGAVRSEDRGYFRITGRIDDVLNVSGHRMGTMEIESALVSKTDLVAEAAVVGRPDAMTGEAICAFVVLKRPVPTGEEGKKIARELRDWVAKEIGPIAKPKGHSLRRKPAEDPLRQDHAPAVAQPGKRRARDAGHVNAGKPGYSRSVGPDVLTAGQRTLLKK